MVRTRPPLLKKFFPSIFSAAFLVVTGVAVAQGPPGQDPIILLQGMAEFHRAKRRSKDTGTFPQDRRRDTMPGGFGKTTVVISTLITVTM